MRLNNNAFFMPTIMIFIFIFTSYILFQTYQTLNYSFLINSYEEETYYEMGVLKAKVYINNYINYDNDFDDTCEQIPLNYESFKLSVTVSPICFKKLEPKMFKRAQEVISNIFDLDGEELEISEGEYKDLIAKISRIQINENEVVEKIKKQVTKEVKEKIKKELIALELSEPEVGIIIEVIKMKIRNLYTQYIAFDVKVNTGRELSNESDILYIYNFEKPKESTIRYT